MADPFDIRNYEKIGPGKGAIDADVLAEANRQRRLAQAEANRQRRLAQFGEEGVKRMERAGTTFGATGDGLPSQRAAPGAASPPPRQAAPARPAPAPAPRQKGFFTKPLSELGVLGKLGRIAGVPLALGTAAYQAATASGEEQEDLMRKLGLEEQSDAGVGTGHFPDSSRVFGRIAQFGNALGFGVPERLIDKFQGRGFFRPDEPEQVTGQEAIPNPTVGGVIAPESGFVPPTSPVVQPVTDPDDIAGANEFIDSNAVPARGAGFIRNNETGAIQQFNPQPGQGVEGGPSRRPVMLQGTGNATVDAAQRLAFEMLPGRVARSNARARAAGVTAQADLVRAQTAANKPELTEVVDSITGETKIYQVRDGVARRLPEIQAIPQGQTPKSMVQSAIKAVKDGDTTMAGVLQGLRQFDGFEEIPDGLKLEDLTELLKTL